MNILRAYKTELDPNNKQKAFFDRCCGASRYVYNWGLAEWEEWYARDKRPSYFKLNKHFNSVKDDLCPWIRNLPYAVTESALRNLNTAFQRYFREKKDGTIAARIAKLKRDGKWGRRYAKLAEKGRCGYKADPGYPKFKKRGGRRASFQVRNTNVLGTRVRITGIGWVRLKEKWYLPSDAPKYGVYSTVSETAGRWYISVLVYEEIPDPVNRSTLVLGVDFGIKSLAVCSDGTIYENPHPLREAQKRLARLQRELARRERGSQNWKKTVQKVQQCHAKIANIRQHALHYISHDVIVNKKPSAIVIENLNVSGMAANHHLAQAVLDAGFYELRRQIEYKASWHGIEVIVADRWYASSKTCSHCGCIKGDLTLADREFICRDCGFVLDRDLNAARNLAALSEGRNTPGLPVELECSEALL